MTWDCVVHVFRPYVTDPREMTRKYIVSTHISENHK